MERYSHIPHVEFKARIKLSNFPMRSPTRYSCEKWKTETGILISNKRLKRLKLHDIVGYIMLLGDRKINFLAIKLFKIVCWYSESKTKKRSTDSNL